MNDRRDFIKILGLGGIGLSLLPEICTDLLANNSKGNKIIKPKKLEQGDKVGIISPASYVSDKEKEEIIENLKKLNLVGEFSKNFLKKNGYLSGTDSERLEDLHEMFARKDIKGIICARGGYGTPRILSEINYSLIKKNPKIIIGYSDITALLQAIYVKTGLITFHGPVGISTFNDFSLRFFNETLFNVGKKIELVSEKYEKNDKIINSVEDITVINDGISEGILIGGNLSLVVSLIGSEFDFNPENKLLFFEEIGEEPYSIDRMLTQLLLTKKLQKCKGIILGHFSNCEVKKQDAAFESSFNLKEVLFDRLSNLKVPVIYGLSFGHIKNKFVLPNGIKARLDTDKRIVTLLESPVF